MNLLNMFGQIVERGRRFEVAAVETGDRGRRTGIFPKPESVVRPDPAALRPECLNRGCNRPLNVVVARCCRGRFKAGTNSIYFFYCSLHQGFEHELRHAILYNFGLIKTSLNTKAFVLSSQNT